MSLKQHTRAFGLFFIGVIMPSRLKKPCSYPGCPNLTHERYCEQHKKQERQRQDEHRGSSRERGYTKTWEQVRMIKLRQDPLCEPCLEAGRVTPAKMVHHIIPISQGGAVLDMGNLMSVCRECHDRLHSKGGGGNSSQLYQ